VFDAGTAPNPYHGVCTLGICKPKIRHAAKEGDIVVGIASGDSGRIIYCMVVTEKLLWGKYSELCTHPSSRSDNPKYANLNKKIPQNASDQGDCIWHQSHGKTDGKVRDSWSHHSHDDYQRDVENGQYVLLSTEFWYFGQGASGGDGFDIRLPSDMPLPNRGHRSTSNADFAERFVDHFNDQLEKHHIQDYGVHGKPARPPGTTDAAACKSCRDEERESDDAPEE
jgi:hypothetical protein